MSGVVTSITVSSGLVTSVSGVAKGANVSKAFGVDSGGSLGFFDASTLGGGGSGTVTTVSVVTANGVSGSVANATTTPAITLTLGAITPSSVNGNTITTGTGTLTLSTFTLTVAATASISGTNTGDQTITLTGDVTGSGTGSFATTIAAAAVTLAMQANVATATVFYRKTAGSGAPEVQTLATLKTDLGLTGTNSGDQTTVSGNAGSATTTAITDDTTTNATMYPTWVTTTTGNLPQKVSSSKLTFNPAAGRLTATQFSGPLSGNVTGDVTGNVTGDVTGNVTGNLTGNADTVTTNANLTGPVTSVGNATTITASAVTLAMQADVATASVFYRKTAGAGSPEVQTLATLKTDLGLTGANSGDQTITLTGNVTGSGTGSFATTIAAAAVTLAMQANVATATVFYRKTAGSGAPEVNTLATLKTDLGLTGTNSGDQTITLTGNVTGSGTGSFATTIAAGVVTNAMLAGSIAASKLVGTDIATVGTLTAGATGAGFTVALTTSTITGTLPAAQMPALTGDVTTSAGAVATTIAAGAVTLAKQANMATASVVYRKTAGAGAPEVQTLATLKTDLGLTGTNSGDQTITLTGDVTGSGTGSFATAIGAAKVTMAMLAGDNSLCNGRLTLTSGTPVTTADVASSTSVYFIPIGGNCISLWNGSSWIIDTFTEITQALGTTVAFQAYDIFAYDSSGTVTLEMAEWANATVTFTTATPTVVTWTAHGLTTGQSITFTNSGGALPTGVSANTQYFVTVVNANTFKISTTQANVLAGTFVATSAGGSGTNTGHQPQARQTAVTLQDGVYCKSGDKTRRYLGSFLAISTTATADSAAQRCLWNLYNPHSRSLILTSTAANRTTTVTTLEPFMNDATTLVTAMVGLSIDQLQLTLSCWSLSSGENAVLTIGVNVYANNATQNVPGNSSNATAYTEAKYAGFPAVGLNNYYALERTVAGGSATFRTTNGGASGLIGCGLMGTIWG